MKKIHYYIIIIGLNVLTPSLFAQIQNLPLKNPIKFSKACAKGETLNLLAVGDVLIHGPLQKLALEQRSFQSLWGNFTKYIEQADVAYANLEGPVANGVNSSGISVNDPGFFYDDIVYTSYPQFNYHPQLIEDLIQSGFDIVSTANNHALDRYSLGINRTIDNLDRAGLPFTGTRKRGENSVMRPWYKIIEKNGFKIAFLSCTFGTNGISDNYHQVLNCFSNDNNYGRGKLLQLVKQLSQSPEIDAVIVTPHWGTEYQIQPDKMQTDLAKELAEAGATAILGSHPHVLQPWQILKTKNGREVLVIYSMANFVSGQEAINKRSSAVLFVGLTRISSDDELTNTQGQNKKVIVNGIRYMATYMDNQPGTSMQLQPLHQGIDDQHPSMIIIRNVLSDFNRVEFGLNGFSDVITNSECNN